MNKMGTGINKKLIFPVMIGILILGTLGLSQDAEAAPGDFIVTDNNGGRLLMVTPGGSVSVIVPSGLGNLHDVAIDSIGDQTGELHRITPGGSVSVIASSGLGNPAGVQTNLAWIVPVVLSVAGIGIFLVKKKF